MQLGSGRGREVELGKRENIFLPFLALTAPKKLIMSHIEEEMTPDEENVEKAQEEEVVEGCDMSWCFPVGLWR